MTTADLLDLVRRMLFHLDAGRSILPGSIAHMKIQTMIEAHSAGEFSARDGDHATNSVRRNMGEEDRDNNGRNTPCR